MTDDSGNPEKSAPDALARTRGFLEQLLQQGIKPHDHTITRAFSEGQVVLVFHNIASNSPEAIAAARSLGWRGASSECIPLNRTRAERIAELLPSADPCSKWLRGKRPGRIFVCSGAGTLCLNYDPEGSFSIEPGTTNGEWMT